MSDPLQPKYQMSPIGTYPSLIWDLPLRDRPRCQQGTRNSLDIALRTMAEDYAAVGVVEKVDNTSQLFEAVLPG